MAKQVVDKRKWTITAEITGVFRGPRYQWGEYMLVDEDAIKHLLHRALIQMETAANSAGECELKTLDENSISDCSLRIHFREPRKMTRHHFE